MNNSYTWRKLITTNLVRLLAASFLLITLQTSTTAPLAALGYQNKHIQPQAINSAAGAEKAGIAPIELNISIDRLYNISQQDESFMADGYIQMRWPGKVEKYLRENSINPGEYFELENDIETAQYTSIRPGTSGATKLDGDLYFMSYLFSGKFSMPRNNFQRSPFNMLNLEVVISPPAGMDIQRTILVPWNGHLAKQTKIITPENLKKKAEEAFSYGLENPTGYLLKSASIRTYTRSFPNSKFSWLAARLTLKPSTQSGFYHYILPLLVVISITISAPSLGSSFKEARIGIPSASILTLVFLHQGYRDNMPSLNYLTFLDILYIYSYISCLLMFLLLGLDSTPGWTNKLTLGIKSAGLKVQIHSIELFVQVFIISGLISITLISLLL